MATEEKDLEKTIAEDLVVTKYKLAGEIVNSEFYSENWREKKNCPKSKAKNTHWHFGVRIECDDGFVRPFAGIITLECRVFLSCLRLKHLPICIKLADYRIAPLTVSYRTGRFVSYCASVDRDPKKKKKCCE